jgi:hypothetical protein
LPVLATRLLVGFAPWRGEIPAAKIKAVEFLESDPPSEELSLKLSARGIAIRIHNAHEWPPRVIE